MRAVGVLGQQAPPGGGGGFDPTIVNWAHLYWSEGSAFTALAYGADAEVTSWPDEISTDDLASVATSYPLHRTTGGPNGTPAVQGDGTNDYLTVTFGASITGTWTVVLVAVEQVNSNRRFFDNGAAGGPTALDTQATTPNYLATAGTNRTGGTPSNGASRFIEVSSGSSPYLAVDGTSVVTNTIGTGDLVGITLFAGRDTTTRSSAHQLALVGIYDGNARADGNWATFKAAAATHYGITIA